jgi:hypothetical protein
VDNSLFSGGGGKKGEKMSDMKKLSELMDRMMKQAHENMERLVNPPMPSLEELLAQLKPGETIHVRVRPAIYRPFFLATKVTREGDELRFEEVDNFCPGTGPLGLKALLK